ncbi:Lamin-like protein [Apostasia shenzhenica]|uniref:Lamin-like protein n=1 Tax=Apostasia shenzhenica TaxID=1088818 RepID=A0A2I0A5L4_9ASPA|nr:Lamin-like protein [Apostasia shenzhenica]
MVKATSLFFYLLLAASATITVATDHIVGGHLGWNPNFNYSLWSNNQTFFVNDLISFRYQKNIYNVFEVNKTGYENCTMDGIAGNWSSGKDFIPLDRPGMYYFLCGNGFCFSGMKVAVKVVPLSTPPPSSSHGHADDHSASPATGRLRPSLASFVAFAALWIGCRI